jgi:hypothetical protein
LRFVRFAFAAAVCLFLTLPPAPCTAQFTTTQINRFIFSKDDVQQMLVQAGASRTTAMKMLERYPSDYQFAEDEVRELLLSIPQEELIEEYRVRQAEEIESEKEKKTVPRMRAAQQLPPLPGLRVRLAKEDEVLPFGYDVFAMSPLEYEPTEDVAVGPDYVLGRGDEVFVTLWGAVE